MIDSDYAREATELLENGWLVGAAEVYERAYRETGNLEFLRYAGSVLAPRPFSPGAPRPTPENIHRGRELLTTYILSTPWEAHRFDALNALVGSAISLDRPDGKRAPADWFHAVADELEVAGLHYEAAYLLWRGYYYHGVDELLWRAAVNNFSLIYSCAAKITQFRP